MPQTAPIARVFIESWSQALISASDDVRCIQLPVGSAAPLAHAISLTHEPRPLDVWCRSLDLVQVACGGLLAGKVSDAVALRLELVLALWASGVNLRWLHASASPSVKRSRMAWAMSWRA